MPEPSPVDGSFVPEVRDPVVDVEVDGERVLLDEETGHLAVLDRVGSVVYPFFDGTATVDELADDVAAAFGEDRERVAGDLIALAEQLREARFLERHDRDEATADDGADTSGVPRWIDPPSA